MRWLLCVIFVVGCAGSRQMHTAIEPRKTGSQLVWRIEQVIPKLANHPNEPPFLNGWPEHIARAGERIDFFNPRSHGFRVPEPLAPDSVDFDLLQPQLRVFEIKKYRAIFHGAEREEFDKRLRDLKTAMRGDVTRLPEIIPAVEAYPAFHANIAAVCGDRWTGVREVTMYVQDDCLVENGRLFYALMGLSDDKRFLITAYWPVRAKGLRAQDKELRADEIERLESPIRYAEYFSEKLEMLDTTVYSPPLEEIDKLVSGLTLERK